MAQSIKISDENYKLICTIAKNERRTRKIIIDRALQNFFKQKKVVVDEIKQ